MKKFGPIFLIWTAVCLSILTLLAKLEIFLGDLTLVFSVATGVAIVFAVVWNWTIYLRLSKRIKSSISTWDEEMKRDIPKFLQTRRMRLAMMSIMMILFYGAHFSTSTLPELHKISEICLYVLIICLFHCSLVSTLILFKMYRVVSWVEHENYLEQLEVS